MCSEALCESEIALYDIDANCLEDSEIILNAINKNVMRAVHRLKHISVWKIEKKHLEEQILW